MNLFFSDSRDKAFLLMIIKEAQSNNKLLGRTALQKIVYFSKVLGVPLNYRFSIHHYGPFCQEILDDVDFLLMDNVVEDISRDSSKSQYQVGQNWEELLNKYSILNEYSDTIKSIVKALCPLLPSQLELMATVDYIYRWVAASKEKTDTKETVIEKVFEIKGNRFSKEEITNIYNLLVSAKLIEN